MDIGKTGANINFQAAKKLVAEFQEVSEKVQPFDIDDKVDLNSARGVVELNFSDLGGTEKMKKYTGKVQFDPETKHTDDMFVTVNYDKPDGVGVNYSYKDKKEEGILTYRKDDMYQEFPCYRDIEEARVDKKTGEVLSYERYEERDGFLMPDGGGSDVF
jgi:hypothetical protein